MEATVEEININLMFRARKVSVVMNEIHTFLHMNTYIYTYIYLYN
jgi:hypothetical protein